MTVFNLFSLAGGLAMFLFGMKVMGESLEKRAGGRLKRILEQMTSSPLRGVLLGFAVTAIIQSSSATTVMIVGFVNSGIMQLNQAIGVIMGANIGTTVTAWLLSMSGIRGDSVWMQLLKPSSFSPILAFIGMIMVMFSKNGKRKDTGTILLGFAILMFGMETMSAAVQPLSKIPEFTHILTLFSNPILGVLAGAVITGIIQSSSASVGILQALSNTGSITYATAIPIILGQNIGTCVTALISSVGTNKNARRAAMVHLYFNIIGTVLFLSLFYSFNAIFKFSFIGSSISAVGIAVIHTTFNVLSTLVLLPFIKQLEKLAFLTIRDTSEVEELQLLDDRLLEAPFIAIERCKKLTDTMAQSARDTLLLSVSMVNKYNEKDAIRVQEEEQKIDMFEDKLGTYLVKLSGMSLTQEKSRDISKLLHTIGDFERISDHAVQILAAASEMHEKNIHFSVEAQGEMQVITAAMVETLNMAIDAFCLDDPTLARKVEPLEEVVDFLKDEIKKKHVVRLQNGLCTIELGFILADLLSNYERVTDHCSNIAVCVIEMQHGSFDTHEYLNRIKSGGNEEYTRYYQQYLEKYTLPVQR